MDSLPEPKGLSSEQLFQLHMEKLRIARLEKEKELADKEIARLEKETELAKIAADKEVALAKIKSDERVKMSKGNFLSTCLV